MALVAAGLLLLIAVGVYYGYRANAYSQLDELNFSIEEPTRPPLAADASAKDVTPSGPARQPIEDVPLMSTASNIGAEGPPYSPPRSSSPPEESVRPVFPESSFASAYPGILTHPKYWGQPLWAGTDPYSYEAVGLPDGFLPVSRSGLPNIGSAIARRIRVPLIGVDSLVSELRLLDLGDSRAYETPDKVVGHIPETSNPGEGGNGWFFGHLESPLRGEGSVFRKLPQIPDLLRDGDPVYVTIESDDGEFLYQVTETRVVHQDDLRLYDSEDASITLVSCVPRLVYDHRLLVTAELVAFKS